MFPLEFDLLSAIFQDSSETKSPLQEAHDRPKNFSTDCGKYGQRVIAP
jgi:hypothetical protein